MDNDGVSDGVIHVPAAEFGTSSDDEESLTSEDEAGPGKGYHACTLYMYIVA